MGVTGGMRRTTLLGIVIMFGLCLANIPANGTGSSERVAAYTPHDQIAIFSDDDFTSDNGVVSGSGTYTDPYVIEGWSIDISGIEPNGNDVMGGGIHIGNTRAYFVVRNVMIQGDYEPLDTTGWVSITGNPAIVMYFGANVKIENCVLKNTTCGIDIRDMGNVEILGNTIRGNSQGVDIEESSLIRMENNYIADSQFGNVRLQWISDSTIKNNTITNSDEWMGMDLYESEGCEVLNNTISNNSNIGLNVGFCRDCRIAGNNFSNNRIGIEIYGEENVLVEENEFAGNEDDIHGLTDGTSYLGLAIVTTIVALAAIAIAVYLLLKKNVTTKPPQ